jgi:hypothetical protein
MSKLVKISDIFDIEYGNSLELISLLETKSTNHNAIPFISRTENNNGASAFVEKELDIKLNSKHTLSVALGGSVLSTFYQPIEYYTGFHIFILTPRKQLSIIEMLYYAKCISSNKYKYSYGRQANKTLKDILIPKKIPTNTKASLISFYQQTLTDISREPINKTSLKISDRNWKRFKLIELFDIKGSKTTSIHDLEDWGYGKSPYVTTQATNNGTGGFYDFYTEKGGCLTVDSAVLGYCSYQENDFAASDHVEKLIPNFEMNKYIALFLTTILNLEQYRYNYGRKCSQTRMNFINIKLPTKNTQPDWQFMEDYIKSLPYSKSL